MNQAADRPGLIARMHANAVEFYRSLVRCSAAGEIREQSGLTLVRSGLPISDFNLAYVLPGASEPAALVRAAAAFFADAPVPWTLMALDSEAADLVGPAAEAAGLEPNRPWPGMLLTDLDRPSPAHPPGLAIVTVEDPTAWSVFFTALAEGFEAPPAVLAPLDTPGWLDVPDLTLYLATLDGLPVGTAMRFLSHGIAGIQAVSTAPRARGRGIGAALTWHAATDHQSMPPLASALQSSDLGFGVYRKLGYEHVVDYPTWTPQATD